MCDMKDKIKPKYLLHEINGWGKAYIDVTVADDENITALCISCSY